MNIFVILIMGIMLATYQYFTAKRSSDVVLNKDELAFQAELTCLKQFHDLATAKNETIPASGIGQNGKKIYECNNNNQETTNELGTSYNCTGKKGITIHKYCVKNGQRVACSQLTLSDCTADGVDPNSVGQYCVSTTKWREFDDKSKYLISQIVKTGVYIYNEQPNKPQSANFGLAIMGSKPNGENAANLKGLGIQSCIQACKVALQEADDNNMCPDGSPAEQDSNGKYFCKPKTVDAANCTAHEYETKTNEKGDCIQDKPGLFCCKKRLYDNAPDTEAANKCPANYDATKNMCCPTGQKQDTAWSKDYRYWRCSDGAEKCNKDVTMTIVDETGGLTSAKEFKMKNGGGIMGQLAPSDGIKISNAATATYDKTNKKFVCKLDQDKFVQKCKEQVTDITRSYIGVEYSQTNNINTENLASVKVACRLVDQANTKAAENCTPCQTAEFSKADNKWKCKDYVWDTETSGEYNLRGNNKAKLIGTLAKVQNPGTSWEEIGGRVGSQGKRCFPNCSAAELKAIAGVGKGSEIPTDGVATNTKLQRRNGKYWGLIFNQKTHMWDCFHCASSETYNYVWKCDDPKHKTNHGREWNQSNPAEKCDRDINPVPKGWKDSDLGKCMPFDCARYQTMIGGQCYTNWCSKNSANFPTFGTIGAPKDASCPNERPFMMQNADLDCVYCILPPPERI